MDVTTLALGIYLTVVSSAIGWLIIRRIDRLETRVDALPTREEFEARVGRVEHEVGALRSDLTQIALAVGARPRPQTG